MLLDIVSAAGRLGTIFYQICLPILLLAGLGYVLQRYIGLDIHTLKSITFYVTLPTVIFTSVATSTVPAGDVGRVLLFVATFLLLGGILTYVGLASRGVDPAHRRAIVITSMNPNAGNFGFPVQELVFRSIGRGAAAQTLLAFVIITQNLLNFTIGVAFLAGGGEGRSIKQHLKTILEFPPIYALVAAIVVKQVGGVLSSLESSALFGADPSIVVESVVAPFRRVLSLIRGAFIPLALLTLGAQLGTMDLRRSDYPVALSVILRIVAGPVFAFLLLALFGIQGFLAQVLFLAFGGPSAVNAMLLCLEFDAAPDLAARTVLYTTLASPISVTILIFLAGGGFFPLFAL